MFNFLNSFFLVNFFYFIITIFIAFYIPGSVLLSNLKLKTSHKVVLGTLTGMIFWGWQGYILGYLNLRNFSYLYLLIFLFLWFRINKLDLQKIRKVNIRERLKLNNPDKLIILIILIGSFVQLTSVFFTGVMTTQGIYFCCGHVPDNILNISITNAVVNHFPPFEPGYFGKLLTNYHYWSSLVIGELIRVFKLPLVETNYQYMTLFISIFLGLIGVVFSEILKLGKIFSRWLILFLYFGSDLIWVFISFYRGSDFFAMSPLESGQQFLENIPRAMAVIGMFTAFSLFMILIKRKDLRLGIILAFVTASLIGFKVYFGFFVFPGLILLSFLFLIKRNYIILTSITLTFILSALVYLPVNSGAGGLYFTGLWRFENFMVQPYLGNLNRMELARDIFMQHNNWIRVVQYELIYIVIFVIAIFGLKVLGLMQSKKSLSLLPFELHVILIPGIIISFIIGSFFNQTSGGSNTFNFLAVIIILSSIYSSLSLSHFFIKNKKIYFAITLIVILLTFPRVLNQTYNNFNNISSLKGFIITNNELKGLSFLKNIKTDHLVLVDPSLFADKESPYISFITNQKMFLSGQGNELTAHNVDFSDRLESLNIILYSPYASSVSAELKRNNIKYLFLLNTTNMFSTKSADFLNVIYRNKIVKILEFKEK